MSGKTIPVHTQFGVWQGRDCVFLDSVMQQNGKLTFCGDLNGRLMDKNCDWIPYELTFEGVLAYFSCELDTYIYAYEAQNTAYSFICIEDSAWLNNFLPRTDVDKTILHHYRLYTYDYVFDVLATGYRLQVK